VKGLGGGAVVAGLVIASGCGGEGGGVSTVPTAPVSFAALATSDTTSSRPQPPARPRASELPGILAKDARAIAGYRSWQRLTRPPREDLRGLGSAHGGQVRSIWVNRSRVALSRGGTQRFPYPVGSIVVKQLGRDENETIIAIMRKIKRSRDLGWSWVEYKRPGTESDFERVSAPTSVCTGCHASAATSQKTDGVFWSLRE
jgi:Cytochrome P460